MAVGAGINIEQKRRKKQPEQAIQKNLVKSLPFILPRGAFMFAVPNGGKRVGKEGAILAGQGVVPGVTDLIILWDGRAFGLEVKAPKGSLSDSQKHAQEAMRRAGTPVGTVHSLPEAIAFLRENQIPLRIKGEVA